jgi:hypothetical protein
MAKSLLVVCAIVLCATLAVISPARADSIDTLSGWTGSLVDAFGELEGNNPGATTFGQTFRLSSDAHLTSITFKTVSKTPDPAPQACKFQVGVAAWNGSSTTGSPLYLSQALTTSTGLYPTDTFNVSLGDALVRGGTDYIVLFTANNFLDGIRSDAMLSFTNDSYAGGSFMAHYGGSSMADLSAWGWWGSPAGDVAMRMEYTPVPEPTTLAMLAFGGVAIIKRRGQSRFRKLSQALRPARN